MPYGKYVLITFGLFGRSGHIPLVPGDDEVAVFFANNSAVEGTTHAMNTTEILETVLQRSAAIAASRSPVEGNVAPLLPQAEHFSMRIVC